MYRKAIIGLSVVAIVLTIVGILPRLAHAQSTTMIVSPSSLQGWTFGTAPYDTDIVFGTTYASIGSGSLEFGPISDSADNKLIMRPPVTDLDIADFTSISFDFYEVSNVSSQQFYINIYVDLAVNGIDVFGTWYDCRYDFVAASGLASNTWHTLPAMDTTTPDNVTDTTGGNCAADIQSNTGNIFLIALNAGDTSTNDIGLQGAIDNVVISTSAGETVYDFEPDPGDDETVLSVQFPNYGLVQINANNPIAPLDGPNGSPVQIGSGTALSLPADADGNGFDTYVVTGCVEQSDTIWASLWLGSDNPAYVDLSDPRLNILTTLPAFCGG